MQNKTKRKEKKIGILGPLGTFTEAAALKYVKENKIKAGIISYDTIPDIFKAVKEGEIEEGVVPIENVLNGHVMQTLDCLYEDGVKIKRAIILSITHNLAALPETVSIKKIMSHIQALAQCSEYLDKNYNRIPREKTESTAAAMKQIKDNNLYGVAAIGTLVGAERYGLKILAKDIGNNKNNRTMFIVLNENGAEKTGDDRTSIAVRPHSNRPGLLRDILEAFAKRNINLEMIQSRPDGGGNYIFYIDLVGHPEDEKVKEAFEEIKEKLEGELEEIIKILGSYPYVTLSE